MALNELPDRETLLPGEILVLNVSSVEEALCQRGEAHQRAVPDRPILRLEVLCGQNHSGCDEFTEIVLEEGVLEDEPHNVECVDFRVVLFSGVLGKIDEELQGFVQENWLVAERLRS